jgi:hypothetical protein
LSDFLSRVVEPDQEPSAITRQSLDEFFRRRGPQLARRTFRHTVQVVRRYLRYAFDTGMLIEPHMSSSFPRRFGSSSPRGQPERGQAGQHERVGFRLRNRRYGELRRLERIDRAGERRLDDPRRVATAVEVLGTASVEIAGIGRNLNQIAPGLNTFPGQTTAIQRAALMETCKAVAAFADQITNVCTALNIRLGRRRLKADSANVDVAA